MPDAPTLRGPRLVLRAPRASDYAERLSLGRDPAIIRMFGGDSINLQGILSTEDVTRSFAEIEGNPNAWVVEHDNRFLGTVKLHQFSQRDRRARLAIGLLDPTKLGCGYGQEAILLVLEHAFDVLELYRVDLRVLEYNERAIRCYLKCGFVEEGREREAALVDNKRYDDVLMGIFLHEFRHRIRER
jgi:[ribosomal protein S5]-alanine N-acetyltransferase